MLYILLGILKIIGIVVLILLGILLFVASMLLFCPLSYYVKGQYTDANKDLLIKARWFFNIVNFQFRYVHNDISYYLKIFGYSFITSNDKIIKRRQEKRNKRQAQKEKKARKEKPISPPPTPLPPQEEKQPAVPLPASTPTAQPKREAKSKKFSFSDFFRRIKESIKLFIRKLRYLRDRKDEIISFLKEEETKQSFVASKGYILRLLKHIRPRKINCYLQFGFEDPAITGQVLGILAIAIPIYKNTVRVIPVFDRVVFESVIEGKGHMRPLHFIRTIISIYRDKVLMMQIKKARNRFGGNRNGK